MNFYIMTANGSSLENRTDVPVVFFAVTESQNDTYSSTDLSKRKLALYVLYVPGFSSSSQ